MKTFVIIAVPSAVIIIFLVARWSIRDMKRDQKIIDDIKKRDQRKN